MSKAIKDGNNFRREWDKDHFEQKAKERLERKVDQTIDTHGDHRFAMSFAILGCHDLRGDGRPWLTLADPGCCAKTFPGFFAVLEELRRASLNS